MFIFVIFSAKKLLLCLSFNLTDHNFLLIVVLNSHPGVFLTIISQDRSKSQRMERQVVVPPMLAGEGCRHRVGRVLIFSQVVGIWDSPNPSPAGEFAPPPLVPGGRAHSLAKEGVGESQFDEGTYTVVLFICMYFADVEMVLKATS
jgi:hypothetical protein